MGTENDPNNQGVADPENGQQPPVAGNEEGSGKPDAGSPTDEIEINGVKISMDSLKGHEKFKDIFDAYDNREKWQKENTQKAQQLAEERRLAEEYRQLSSDPRFREFMSQGAKPKNDYEAQRQTYVQKKQQQFPDVDPRFFMSQFDDIWEMSGMRAQGSITPLLQQQSEQWEAQYLKDHPLVQKGSEKYYAVADLVGKGYDSEHAYNIVYGEELMNQKLEAKIKARDEEAKRKLQQKPTPSSKGTKQTTPDESFERAWAKHGGT